MTTLLDYVPGSSVIPPNTVGISPSGLSRFFTEPSRWYHEHVLGQGGFEGSTSSYLGSIVHFVGEQFASTQSVDKTEIYKYLSKELNHEHSDDLPFDNHDEMELILSECPTDDHIDLPHILEQYPIMGNALIQHLRQTGLPDQVEAVISAEILPGYYACGSADALRGTTLIDYKTTSSLTPPSSIPWNYKLQLLTYAWIYTQMGHHIDRIQIIWVTQNQTNRVSPKTGKPMKDYPTQVVPLTETIDTDDLEYISNLLHLVAETLSASAECQHIRHLLWKDYRLKTPHTKENNVS